MSMWFEIQVNGEPTIAARRPSGGVVRNAIFTKERRDGFHQNNGTAVLRGV